MPFYGQINTAILRRPFEEHPALLAWPISEASAAFRHYLENDNPGRRPFFLAGHSQGADVIFRGLLSQVLKESAELRAFMAAAYIPGFAVTESLLQPHLAFAQGRRDTGVIISYNTEARDLDAPNPFLQPGTLAINPISWVRDETRAPASLNLGADLSRFKGPDLVPGFTGARLNLRRGSVECDLPAASPYQAEKGGLAPGIFHDGDFAFFHHDLRRNARDRLAAWFAGRRIAGPQGGLTRVNENKG